MKINELLSCYKAIDSMKTGMKLPISLSLVLDDNFRKIDPIMRDAEDKRLGFIEKDDYSEKLEELLNTEIDISLSKIPMKILARCDEDPRYDALNYEQVSTIRQFMLKEDEPNIVLPD